MRYCDVPGAGVVRITGVVDEPGVPIECPSWPVMPPLGVMLIMGVVPIMGVVYAEGVMSIAGVVSYAEPVAGTGVAATLVVVRVEHPAGMNEINKAMAATAPTP